MKRTSLGLGIILLACFALVLFLIFMPIFGNGQNGLAYSDEFFNALAKGSSNHMASMRKLSQGMVGTPFAAEIKMASPQQAQATRILYTQAGAEAAVTGAALKISGDLGKVLLNAVADADLLFNEQGENLANRYHYNAKAVLNNWWLSFNKLDAALKKQKNFKQAQVIAEVQKRSLEPAYNFSGIAPSSVGENALLLTLMLGFYVIYTLFYGYGIFEIFEGLGLQMEKSTTKEEV
jgi:hypothetical protein